LFRQEISDVASVSDKYKDNVPGAFYTDTQCIDCELCQQTAPKFFARNGKGGYSFVYAQPQTDADRSLCEQAREECPVEAIGNDGTTL
jgi:ferredoxin